MVPTSLHQHADVFGENILVANVDRQDVIIQLERFWILTPP
jgi:MOSC domain-containing protein YiiM